MKRLRLIAPAILVLFAAVAAAADARAQVLFSSSGIYAFPVAGNTADMAWTQFHWNGGNAADIVPAPGLSVGSEAFTAFERSPIVAVVAGMVRRADNELGGMALLLYGDDGREYYYAHLSSTDIARPTRVSAGERIGVIGRSGRWARYLEIHLHFAISSKWRTGLSWPNDVNVAEWFRSTFGLQWMDQTPIPYPPAFPSGSPLASPYRIVARFAQMRAENPDAASIRMQPEGGVSHPVPVYSTLLGEVRVMRATVFGLRVQVTNRYTKQTVVYSGLSSAAVQTGSLAERGELVGWTSGPIDYMFFDRGILTDPTPMLAAGVDRSPAAVDSGRVTGPGERGGATTQDGTPSGAPPADGSQANGAGSSAADLLN